MRTSSLPSKFGECEWKKYQLHKGWVGLILCMLWEDQAGKEGYWGEYISEWDSKIMNISGLGLNYD